MSIGPNVVLNCPCGHKSPPQGSNDTCPYVPGKTCGGITYGQCPYCYANAPPVAKATNDPPQNIPLQMDTSAAGEWRGIPIEQDEADSGKQPESGE